ncbi:MAG: hypothetical protein BGO70_13065 [Bacteroidetes bacterium 43-93]|nr:response regulator [Bacteroidota bacterium]OJW99370.1 MAG: hypothetical protein BGO70_13065 [Bacteroidetes bacterium 43-93]
MQDIRILEPLSTVMVIDDTEIDRYIAERMMTRHTFATHIIKMGSGADALNYLQASGNKLPQMIFLDINMPGMNGFEFLEQYESLSDDVKQQTVIIMLTSSINPEDIANASRSPYVKHFVNKPLTFERLSEVRELV